MSIKNIVKKLGKTSGKVIDETLSTLVGVKSRMSTGRNIIKKSKKKSRMSTGRNIIKKSKKVTVVLDQPVYTKDKSRFFNESWEEEKKQLFFK